MKTLQNLKEVRERFLGYQFDSVVRFARIPAERLRELEAGVPATVYEVDALGRVYGIDADLLWDTPIRLAPGDAVEALASLEEFREVADGVRLRIVAAARAAKDVVRLRNLERPEDRRSQFNRDWSPLSVDGRQAPFRQGARIAQEVRRRLRLGRAPITSLRGLMGAAFPALVVLDAHLTPEGPAGLSFADALRGPTIILNLDGKNENPLVRRFSLAHELCHILVDWQRAGSLAVLSGYLTESGLDRERRANAFAVRLLCPEGVLRKLDVDSVLAARELLSTYGLPYSAARLYLQNEAGQVVPAMPPPTLADVGTGTDQWARAEEPPGLIGFPLDEVAPERRTAVALAAARAYASGRLPRDAFADALGVTPAAEVERVLDYTGLNPPPGEPPTQVA